MNCTNCQRQVSEQASFCNHCGTRLRNRCGICQTLNPIESRYCFNCGGSLEESSQAGIRASQPDIREQYHQTTAAFAQQCPRCQALNESDSQFCYRCGMALDGSESASFQQAPYGQAPYRQYQYQYQEGTAAFGARPAGFWIRLLAYIIDVVILTIVVIILVLTLNRELLTEANIADNFNRINWLSLIVSTLYFTLTVGFWGTTAGKRVLGLYVVRTDGSKIAHPQAFARALSQTVTGAIFSPLFIVIGLRADKRGIHDLISGTMVLKR